jgi:hypothetical protein
MDQKKILKAPDETDGGWHLQKQLSLSSPHGSRQF